MGRGSDGAEPGADAGLSRGHGPPCPGGDGACGIPGPPPATETLRETERINLNTATAEELTRLRGVGEALAQRIVAYREEHGPFRRVEEITRVNGIGQAVLENNWSILTVEEDTT